MTFVVAEARAEIVGAPDIHIKAGSNLRLVCQVRFATELPEFVFWYRADKMVNYDEEGVTVIAPSPSATPAPGTHAHHSHQHTHPVHVSQLLVEKASMRDSGNYTCTPSNALPASIMVHVLQGKLMLQVCFIHIKNDTLSFGMPYLFWM